MVKRLFHWSFAGITLAVWLAASAAGAAVRVRVGPPRAVVERPVRRPGAAYVWVGGYYRWSGRSYVWVPGAWALPPRPTAVWVAPRWDYVPAKASYVFIGDSGDKRIEHSGCNQIGRMGKSRKARRRSPAGAARCDEAT
ncbi:MAG TPA: YXWGXW repeat-containing protein [Bryobacteraceae bacterium]|nr:YXWGXW repeat-containing protein [Bryobacteraceae bacterium]